MVKSLKEKGISFEREAMPKNSYVRIEKVSFGYSDKFETETAEIDGAITGSDFKDGTSKAMFTTSQIVVKQLKDIMTKLGYQPNEPWAEPIGVFTKTEISEKARREYITLE
jgi:hypothetical protein